MDDSQHAPAGGEPSGPSARLRVVYLLGVAVVAFAVPSAWVLGALLVLQAGLWGWAGLGARRLARQVGKFWGIALVVVLSYAFVRLDPARDEWVRVGVEPWAVSVNLTGVWAGARMVLRLLCVVLASQVARAGDARAIARGLRGIGVPPSVAATVDAVLALFEPGGRGRRRKRGGRAGRREEGGDTTGAARGGLWAAARRVGRGDVEPIVEGVERNIERARTHIEEAAAEAGDEAIARRARDLGIVAGVALAMLGVRALKILPSVPFAPGHKLVVLTPLYILAAALTRSRLGATLTGTTMGVVSFLVGDGKYGIFEILKHIAPGLVCDAGVPWMLRGGRMPGGLAWSAFGAVVAAGRYATIVAIVFVVQAPAIAWAILGPGMAVHCTFGALSGYVSWHLVRVALRRRDSSGEES